ncbi:hypothetical protein GF360_01275 [candidate division WWE3 bacterium]|nr:hypothetical protein [candidate division WWE3 bacterium]
MEFNPRLARILSDFFRDIATASFIAGFVTGTYPASAIKTMFLLINSLTLSSLFLGLSWITDKMGETL